ncbi:hypothetical protein N7468_002235 [Penicillium chermesinum]|uniref:Uncharacterized protein n=1 Tax=Penicillium chermesinum TaxID=63820 RepID=A0A9W9TXS7_9EURO|nr:uncharacterized protein N7468_002235 [Penicillium chermesinum]KAJ5247252.1 hypothetical protein N7468_002235 [Penicillium chermesinum]
MNSGPMRSMSNKTKPKQRPVTFSGCWTCKERKVKCDENPRGYDIESDAANGVLSTYGPFTAFSSTTSIDPSLPPPPRLEGSAVASESERIKSVIEDVEGVSSWNSQLATVQSIFPKLSTQDQMRLANYIHLQFIVSSFVEGNEQGLNTPLYPQPQFLFLEGPKTNALFDYYSTRVANVLQPLSHPENPYRSIYVPLAVEGVFEMGQIAKMVAPCVKICTFHAIIATAAFHMHGSDVSGSSEYHKIGHVQRQMALKCMQLALLDETLPTNYQSFMTAMMSLLTVGVMEGRILDFHVHIQAMIELRKSRRDWKILSSQTRQLNDMSRFLILLSRTTSHSIPAPITLDDRREICTLRTQLHHPFLAAQHPIPDPFALAAEQLGNKLISWHLSPDIALSIFPTDPSMQLIFSHHAQAWHAAAYIYYLHCIQGIPPLGLMEHVARVAFHMHAVEDLKLLTPESGPMAPITWPAFVASCCAVQRETWVEWWGRVQFYRIGGLGRQFEVVKTVWEEMDLGTGESWVDILGRRGIEVLAL